MFIELRNIEAKFTLLNNQNLVKPCLDSFLECQRFVNPFHQDEEQPPDRSGGAVPPDRSFFILLIGMVEGKKKMVEEGGEIGEIG